MSHAVEVDMGNSHSAPLIQAPQQTYSGGPNVEGARSDEFPALVNYVQHYSDRRAITQEYYDVGMGDAVKATNILFYGGCFPRGDVPTIHFLRIESKSAAMFLEEHRFY